MDFFLKPVTDRLDSILKAIKALAPGGGSVDLGPIEQTLWNIQHQLIAMDGNAQQASTIAHQDQEAVIGILTDIKALLTPPPSPDVASFAPTIDTITKQ